MHPKGCLTLSTLQKFNGGDSNKQSDGKIQSKSVHLSRKNNLTNIYFFISSEIFIIKLTKILTLIFHLISNIYVLKKIPLTGVDAGKNISVFEYFLKKIMGIPINRNLETFHKFFLMEFFLCT